MVERAQEPDPAQEQSHSNQDRQSHSTRRREPALVDRILEKEADAHDQDHDPQAQEPGAGHGKLHRVAGRPVLLSHGDPVPDLDQDLLGRDLETAGLSRGRRGRGPVRRASRPWHRSRRRWYRFRRDGWLHKRYAVSKLRLGSRNGLAHRLRRCGGQDRYGLRHHLRGMRRELFRFRSDARLLSRFERQRHASRLGLSDKVFDEPPALSKLPPHFPSPAFEPLPRLFLAAQDGKLKHQQHNRAESQQHDAAADQKNE